MTTPSGFSVELEVFTGPFDLLLQLIAKHRLDVTEVALAQVTDDFLTYALNSDWDLSEASQFLVVAATLLDLKAQRLLPRSEATTEEDLELLEARDLLFARLLQYRAYKEVAEELGERLDSAGAAYPRAVPLEPQFAQLLPELIWSVTPTDFHQLAVAVFTRSTETPVVAVDHLHHPVVPVHIQAAHIVGMLKERGRATFSELTAGAELPVKVARFLALLELFREELVDFDQPDSHSTLTVVYLGDAETTVHLRDEYDDGGPRE